MKVNSFADANLLIARNYAAMSAALGGEAKAALDAVVGTPVMPEKVARFLELAYAQGDRLPKALREAAADIGDFATANGFYGLGEDRRGAKMATALRKARFARGKGDPKPLERFSGGH